jgi:NADH-quinone oxidoreductase subunit K
MLAIDTTTASIIYVTSFVILLIGYLTAISSKDVIRLLISLELMFGAVFMALIPLFSVALLANAAFGIAIVTIFTSSGELLILIAAIAILDKQKRDIHTKVIKIGGDRV